jgi:Uma2 family endonuclease
MEKLTADPHTGRVVWTREAFRMMADAGIFSDGRYELLEGEIVKIMPNEPHTFVNTRLVFRMARAFGEDFVRVPGSLIAGPGSEPEPDVAVTRQRGEYYLRVGIPQGDEFRLVIEVSDTTLWRDKGQKATLYAGAGVPEYWIVNLSARTLIVHRNPALGEYRSIQTYDETQSVAPEAAPEHPVKISEILPPTE